MREQKETDERLNESILRLNKVGGYSMTLFTPSFTFV